MVPFRTRSNSGRKLYHNLYKLGSFRKHKQTPTICCGLNMLYLKRTIRCLAVCSPCVITWNMNIAPICAIASLKSPPNGLPKIAQLYWYASNNLKLKLCSSTSTSSLRIAHELAHKAASGHGHLWLPKLTALEQDELPAWRPSFKEWSEYALKCYILITSSIPPLRIF